ncbi:hypothetical protein [Flindersiella endophytica]
MLAGVPGLLAVLVTVLAAPGGLGWFVLIAGGLAVVPGMIHRTSALFEPVAFIAVIIGAAGAAASGRLPAILAVLVGILLLAYAITIELADELAGNTVVEPGTLRRWASGVLPLLAVGVVAAATVGVVLLLPIPPLALAVFLAPLALMLAAVLTFGGRMIGTKKRANP